MKLHDVDMDYIIASKKKKRNRRNMKLKTIKRKIAGSVQREKGRKVTKEAMVPGKEVIKRIIANNLQWI